MNEQPSPPGLGHHDAGPLTVVPPPTLPVPRVTFDAKKLQIVKDTIAKGCSDNELGLFVEVCKRTGLDPFARQIYAIKRGDTMTIQMSIDGFRLIAERSGRYQGQLGPYWCAEDGEWREIWVEDAHPTAAKVGVLRADFTQPLWATARFKSYAQYTAKGLGVMWERMGDVMIAKCAEAQALRRAFPNELSGLYVEEEMNQADVGPGAAQLAAPAVPAETPEPPRAKRTSKPKAAAAQPPAQEPAQEPAPAAESTQPAASEEAEEETPVGLKKVDQKTMAQVRALLQGFGGNEERVTLVQGIEPAAIAADSLGNPTVSLPGLTQDQADALAAELKRRAQGAATAKS